MPFRSAGGTLPALLGDQINATFSHVSLLKSYVQAGKVTPLAIASPQRSPLLPELVTMAEVGLPGIEAENWYGLVASVRTPSAIVARLRAALLATHDDPAYRESMVKQGTSAGEPGGELRQTDPTGTRQVETDRDGSRFQDRIGVGERHG